MTKPAVVDLFDFSNSVALVTGASSGIGRAIALRFAEAGAAVCVHYLENLSGAQQTLSLIESLGGRGACFQADLSQRQGAVALVEHCTKQWGGVHSVINNAGIYPVSPLLEMTETEWQDVLHTNLSSVHYVTQAVASWWRDQELVGSVVNIASIEGLIPADQHAHYASAKAGVLMHTRAAALELGPYGIRVNSVAPGLIYSEGLPEVWPDGVERWLAKSPLGKMGEAFQVADACLFLSSRGSLWTTGATLNVDGGITARAVF